MQLLLVSHEILAVPHMFFGSGLIDPGYAFFACRAEDGEESTLSSLLNEVEEVRARGGLELDDDDDDMDFGIDMDMNGTPPQQQPQRKQQKKPAFLQGEPQDVR